ncbi:MAG: T9SS type A sorting domain-containing protein [Dysgonamonadaceae bacterium]|jgi:predicted outer membrane repeat protein|nr:T9SS type A sorting domain-containing protein [Dysgonamonadaceae bacterium]
MKKFQLLLTRGCNPLFLTFALLLGSLANSVAGVVYVSEPTQAAIVDAIALTNAGDTIKFDTSTWGENRTIPFTTVVNLSKDLYIDGENNQVVLSGGKSTPLFKGSALLFSASNLTFKDAKSTAGRGAAIDFQNRSYAIVTLTNVRFIDNEASMNGGAVDVSGYDVTATVNNCYFSGNRAASGGGAIYASGGGTLIVSNSIFENNSSNGETANFGGGAIQGERIIITGSLFKNNTGKNGGGAIYSHNNSKVSPFVAKLLGNTFIDNRHDNVATAGGGVFGVNDATVAQMGRSVVFLAGNVFQGNTSANNAVNNEFYSANANGAITSAGYNVFKGEALPVVGGWTSAATDLVSVDDIVDAETCRIADTSPAFEIIPEGAALIEGLPFPTTDLFGNRWTPPYNAGADQTNTEVDLQAITADQPTVYPHNEEKTIGSVLVDAPPLSFSNIGFSVPEGTTFTATSATLKEGSAFSLSGIEIGNEGTHLQLTVNFAPTAEQEYRDTLTVTAAGAYDYVIPLRGSGIAWTIAPAALSAFSRTLPGSVSAEQTITITGTSASVSIAYSLKSGQNEIFPITEAEGYSEATGGELAIRFAPATFATEYRDTLLIVSEGSERTFEFPLSGRTPLQPVITTDSTFYRFGETARGKTVTGGKIEVTLSNPQSHLTAAGVFTFARAEEYAATQDSIFKIAHRSLEGGTPTSYIVDVTLSFTPPGSGEFLDTLIIRSTYAGEYRLPLSGVGFTPVVTADVDSLDFSEVNVGQSKDSTITVALTDPAAPLTAADFSLAGTVAAGIFEIASIVIDANPLVVTLTFTPTAAQTYLDTLIVRAAYADEYRIPLSGSGISGVAIPVTKAAAATFVSVRDRNIVVSQAPVGSLIRVYNLHGKALKTQAVTSNVETLKTASLPKSVYIVVVNNDNQEILRKKVVL